MLEIKQIKYNEDHTPGCETCDWGSSYVNEVELTLENGIHIYIEVDKMYEYTLSESDIMQLIANTNDIDSFYIELLERIKSKQYYNYMNFAIELEHLTIKINGQNVDILKSLEQEKIIFKEKE